MRVIMENGDTNTEAAETDYSTVKSVETSLTIVEFLQGHGEIGVTALSKQTGLSKSNVYKHLLTLRQQGLVEKNGDKYRLSLRYLDLGGSVREQYTTPKHIKPKIAELAVQTAEVAQFMVESRGYSVITFKEVGPKGVFTRTRIGTHMQMHQVASGKAMLAKLDDARVKEIIERQGLEGTTENTITDRDELFAEIDKINRQGYATNDAESTEGLYAIAVPVEGPDGFLGACAVSGPSYRIQEKIESENLIDVTLSLANEIELNIVHG